MEDICKKFGNRIDANLEIKNGVHDTADVGGIVKKLSDLLKMAKPYPDSSRTVLLPLGLACLELTLASFQAAGTINRLDGRAECLAGFARDVSQGVPDQMYDASLDMGFREDTMNTFFSMPETSLWCFRTATGLKEPSLSLGTWMVDSHARLDVFCAVAITAVGTGLAFLRGLLITQMSRHLRIEDGFKQWSEDILYGMLNIFGGLDVVVLVNEIG